jgi:23S rRNA pseudouridine1911/1915/1917 synthase
VKPRGPRGGVPPPADTASDPTAVDGVADGLDEDDRDDDALDDDTDRRAGATHAFVVAFGDRGQRLDALVPRHVQGLSRSRAAALLTAGHVTVDGHAARPSTRARGGERVVVVVPPAAPAALVAEDLPLSLVYDDDDLCVVDKRAGVVVHPAVGHPTGTLVHGLLFRFPGLTVGGEQRPGIVHRLDKDTSGLLVVAKHDQALHGLGDQFRRRTVDKRYVALCCGLPGAAGVPFDVVTGHARHGTDRRRFSTRLPAPAEDDPRSGVRRAFSRFCVRAARDGVAVVDVELHTGRTHQIRAHLADRGHPLLQDALYGGGQAQRRLQPGPVRDAVAALQRHALHAAQLSFHHPRTGDRLTFHSPLPADLAAVVDAVLGAADTAGGRPPPR